MQYIEEKYDENPEKNTSAREEVHRQFRGRGVLGSKAVDPSRVQTTDGDALRTKQYGADPSAMVSTCIHFTHAPETKVSRVG